MSILTPDEEDFCASLLDVAFDTFKHKYGIVVYKTPEKLILSTDPNYNYLYQDNDPNNSVDYQVVSGKFDATVEYIDTETSEQMMYAINARQDAPRVITSTPKIRISVKQDFVDFVPNFEVIELDGYKCKFITVEQPRGIFKTNYYNYWLERVK